eukprot:188810_1
MTGKRQEPDDDPSSSSMFSGFSVSRAAKKQRVERASAFASAEPDQASNSGPTGPIVIPMIKDLPATDAPSSSSMFSGFSVSRAAKKQRVERASAFASAEPDQASNSGPTGPIVIPMIKDNEWANIDEKKSENSKSDPKVPPPLESPKESDEETLRARAVRSLLSKATDGPPDETDGTNALDSIPLILQNKVPGLDSLNSDESKFLHDVSLRPEAISFTSDKYDRVPIDAFGAAMLRGMGWTDGGKIGRTNAGVAKPVEFTPRGRRQGLGAEAKVAEPPTRKDGRRWISKPGEKRKSAPMRARPDSDGRTRHHHAPGEKLMPAKNTKPHKDALVEIMSGKHSGLFGRIAKLSESKCEIRLNISDEKVLVSLKRISVLDEHMLSANHAAFRTRASHSGSRSSKSSEKAVRITWVVPHTRVRVVSKSLGGGRFYTKKGRVVDVVSPFEFMLLMDSGETLCGVFEKNVETVAPKVGRDVIMVCGEHKGRSGRLLEKSSSKNTAAVQFLPDLDVVKCTLDDLCEYVGPTDTD